MIYLINGNLEIPVGNNMKFLRHTEREKANNINQFIRNYAAVIEESFHKCDECNGTGLYGVSRHEQGASWDGISYCEKCEGTGYIDWIKSETFFVCDKCDGLGCGKCDGKGVVDWITGIRLGISK